MIQIKDLSVSHKKDLRPLLDKFSFTLAPGDKAVIIGEEGNGKSTLLKWMAEVSVVVSSDTVVVSAASEVVEIVVAEEVSVDVISAAEGTIL